MIDETKYIAGFVPDPEVVFNYLLHNVSWDERMTIRKTASYGVAYNYSQISYPDQPLLPVLKTICENVTNALNFRPNNCLINYYPNGKSKMGFHSDQTEILEAETGIVIISLGTIRVLRFRNIHNKELKIDVELMPGSLFYMTQQIQTEWQHAILKSDTDRERISLTLRSII